MRRTAGRSFRRVSENQLKLLRRASFLPRVLAQRERGTRVSKSHSEKLRPSQNGTSLILMHDALHAHMHALKTRLTEHRINKLRNGSRASLKQIRVEHVQASRRAYTSIWANSERSRSEPPLKIESDFIQFLWREALRCH